MLKKQGNFSPRMIKKASEIKVGDRLVAFHCGEEMDRFEVIGFGVEKVGGKMCKFLHIRDKYGLRFIFYADRSLMPYPSGWNPSNWLEKED